MAAFAFGFAATFADDGLARGLKGFEQAGTGCDFVRLARGKNGQCGHGEKGLRPAGWLKKK
jgi:hypothetical protein